MKQNWFTLPIAWFVFGSMMWCSPDTVLSQVSPQQTKFLAAAVKVENWLASVKRTDPDGRDYWPTSPDESQEFTFGLYHGNSGVIGFYLQLHEITNDQKYLQQAIKSADHLLHKIDLLDSKESPGLYSGVAGYGQTMINVWKITKDEKHKRAALKCLEHIAAQSKSKESYAGNACHFNGVTDVISGSAGIIHFLLDAHQSLEFRPALDLAIGCGDGLVSDGIKTKSTDSKLEMLHWRMTDQLEREYPNVSHGTAGVADALMQLDEAVKSDGAKRNVEYDNRFLDAAIKGGEYLKSIATVKENQCLIFHHSPEGEELFYLGWCHGPPGTSALFINLGERTNNNDFRRLGYLGAAAILQNELYKNRTPGFWNNVGQCCGTAGVASFMSYSFRKTGDEIYLLECRRLTEDLLNRATKVKLSDGKDGLKWIQAEHRIRPDELKAQTGFMQGAAGVGQWLLDMHELESQVRR